jgi:hypothetical protein
MQTIENRRPSESPGASLQSRLLQVYRADEWTVQPDGRSSAMRHGAVSAGGEILFLTTACLMGLGLLGWSAMGRQDQAIDFDKARQLHQRMLKGERLSDEDRAYLERAKAAFQKKQAGTLKGSVPPAKDHLGLVPLTDMAGETRYKWQDGGLYGGGRNQPPEAHLRAALAAAGRIRPLDAAGHPSPEGKVVLISVGMSNTTQEYQAFMRLAGRDPDRSPALVLVDGAQGGMVASAWTNPERVTRMGRPDPWAVLGGRLEQAGVTAAQVQAAWLKQALPGPASLGDFPKHAETLKDDVGVLVRMLKARFPNLQLVYLSSRIYAGYATTPLNPEPYAYESAFSVRWLIRDQIDRKAELNPEPARGDVRAPVLLWGAYLWADGVKGRKADALSYERADLAADGTHPSPKGQQKVAALLLQFFKTDPTTRGWFSRPEHEGKPRY